MSELVEDADESGQAGAAPLTVNMYQHPSSS